jgi:hypothetical protein
MSHSHVDVPKPPARRRPWLEVGFSIGFAFVVALVHLFISWDRPSMHDYFTAPGTILDSRIVVETTRDSPYGGSIYYQVQAHVKYEIDGQPQDRWLAASDISRSRAFLAATLAAHPASCLVFWQPDHPEVARCKLKKIASASQ